MISRRTLGIRGAIAISAVLALTASTGIVAVAQEEGSVEKGMICVIVPPVENPFFGAMQQIAADKAEELGYTTTRLVHDDDANKQLELFESCISQGAQAIILGCTELPLLLKQDQGRIPLFDTTTIHARAAVEQALGH